MSSLALVPPQDDKQPDKAKTIARRPARLRVTSDFFVREGMPHIVGEQGKNLKKVQKAVEEYFQPDINYLFLAANRTTNAEWRLGRGFYMTNAAVNVEIYDQLQDIKKSYARIRTPMQIWLAWRKTAKDAAFTAIGRDESRALQVHKYSAGELRERKKAK